MTGDARRPAQAASAIVRRHAVDVDGLRVTYRRAGSGPPVVVLGSVAHSTVLLVPLLRDLASTCTVLALDPPGYGRSDAGDPEVPALARRAAATLDALGVGPAVLVGIGTGGQVAVELAHLAPLRALVLDGLPPFEDLPDIEPFVPTLDGAHVVRQWGRRRLELTFAADGSARAVDLAAELPLGLHEAVVDELDAGDRYRCSVLAAARHDPGPALAESTIPVVMVATATPTAGSDGAAGASPAEPRSPTGTGDADVPGMVIVDAGTDPAGRRARIVELVARHACGDVPPCPPRPAPARRLATTFATTPWGQVAVRHGAPAGSDARPLVMLHASPLAGELLLPLAEAVLPTRPVLVVDTLGNGDSDKPDTAAHPQFRAPRVDDYAQVVLAALDDLGVGECHVYGAHSGAVIAMEVAIAAPDRVRRLVLDGLPLFSPADVDELFGEYTIDLAPRADGAHLLAAWWNAADVLTWFPWFRRDPAHRRALPRPDPWQLHRRFVQMARSGVSYPLSHHAVAVHPVRGRLPLVTVPTLFAHSPADPLGTVTTECAALVPDATVLPFTNEPATDAATLSRWLESYMSEV